MSDTPKSETAADRRQFLKISTLAAGASVTGAYGYFAWMAGSYLAPLPPKDRDVFIARTAEIKVGASFAWTTPSGGKVLIARIAEDGEATDFRAMTDVCPHLGCKVHWQAPETRFFCPCHNGTFDAEGKGTGGPPGEAEQNLETYPLVVRDGMLFVKLKQERGL